MFGHLNPPPTTQIFYKILNDYSKKALYPETRVFQDYECATTHCNVLNEYNLDELIHRRRWNNLDRQREEAMSIKTR